MNLKRSKLNLHSVPIVQELNELTHHPMTAHSRTVANDWQSYLKAVTTTVVKIRENHPLEERDHMIRDIKIFNQKLYLGSRFRSFTAVPKVLTPQFCDEIKLLNQVRRRREVPLFVRMSELLIEIENLEEQMESGI